MKLVLTCFLALALSCSNAMDRPSQAPESDFDQQRTDAEVLRVVSAAIHGYEAKRFRARPSTLVVYEETLDVSSGRLAEKDLIRSFREDALAELQQRNPGRLLNFENQKSIRFVDAAERTRLFPVASDDAAEAWRRFRETFPDAVGLLSFTLPGYSGDHRRAIVYCELHAGTLGGNARLVQLKRVGDEWRIERTEVLRVF